MAPLTEKEYTDLYKYSLQAAYRFVGYREAAYDMAQNALLSFITSKVQINSPQAWIRVVLRKEAHKYFVEQQKINSISKRNATEPVVQSEDSIETDRILALSDKEVKKLISNADFQIFHKLKKAKFSVQTYSRREDISYNTARNHKARIKRNIIANLLWNEGWRTGTKIMNYTQYYNIQRFINTLISSVKDNKLDELIHYTAKTDIDEVRDIFTGINQCLEWSVSFHDPKYRVFLVCMDQDNKPEFISLFVRFGIKNTINILNLYKNKAVHEGKGDLKPLSKVTNKGLCEITEEQYKKQYKNSIISIPASI